jgi:hypothetical protein
LLFKDSGEGDQSQMRSVRKKAGSLSLSDEFFTPINLDFSQISKFVKSPPGAGRLGSSLPGRKLSRLTPTDVGTLCAFLMGA